MRARLILFALLLCPTAPAGAERLTFDHRLSPPLKAVLDSGDATKMSFNNDNPRYLVDVIAVRGASATEWIEALVIIARTADRKVNKAQDWVRELQREAGEHCRARFAPLAEDQNSVTFERRSSGCPPGFPPVGLYRVVQGKTSLFLLAALAKDGLDETARGKWLALLASAHLE